jgi:hypothetical protein
MTIRCKRFLSVCAVGLNLLTQPASAADLPAWDFSIKDQASNWSAAHDLTAWTQTTNGIEAGVTGGDPYLIGPARDYPAGQPLRARLRLQSTQGGLCQLFYYRTVPAESNSVRFSVPAGKWVEGRVALPALGPGYQMRIDPPGAGGAVLLRSLSFEAAGDLPDFDLGTLPDANEWVADHDISKLSYSVDGLNVSISGGDPYLHGPARNYPTNTLLWLNLRLKSDQAGACQVFYFQSGATEADSVRFSAPAGQWFEARVPLPALGKGYHLRIDPPGQGGNCLLGRLWFEERILLAAPAWPQPVAPVLGSGAHELVSGQLRLAHNADALGGFAVRVGETWMASGNSQGMIGYLDGPQTHWLRLTNDAANPLQIQAQSNAFLVQGVYTDDQGGGWTIRQRFEPGETNAIQVEASVSVDQPRQVVYLPMFTLLPGLGTFGTNKNQALFAGVEYLENEPSSSEADLKGPAARRLVPDRMKITFPLMAVQAAGCYVGLVWEPDPRFSSVFDSPDRQFNSGGHLLGALFPGSDGVNREEGSLLPYDGQLLAAGAPVVWRGAIIGGPGQSIVPAVRHYVALKGLPAPPDPGRALADYARLEAHGWLDSGIRATNLYRHAAATGFSPQPAADAALWMRWLAGRVDDPALANRLTQASAAAAAQVPANANNSYQLGHVRTLGPALALQTALAEATNAQSQGASLLRQFSNYGTLYYQPGSVDYGSTHWTNEANGLTAVTLLQVLQDAAFSGNRNLIQEGLKHLRALEKFARTVPRGAQTWEIPLHTPDILASAYLLRAYTLGYELSGDPEFLEQARYWAWTGVPFVYLTPPTEHPAGIYGTIAVLGATGWVAPVWIGLPVQWCGLVYSDALFRFAPYDATGPWMQLAKGITAAGIQFTWPVTDTNRQGLLPDSYVLRSQTSDGPPINPATLLASAAVYYGQPAFYDSRSFPRHGLLVHAPGSIDTLDESAGGVAFRARGWQTEPYDVLVTGVWKTPQVKINGAVVPLTAPHQYDWVSGRVKLQVSGDATIEIIYPATGALRIERGTTPGAVILRWPSSADAYVLEASGSLQANAVWEAAGAAASNATGFEYKDNAETMAQRFFRLRLSP